MLKEGGADVILATSNSYKATADSIKGLRPEGRVILMGVSMTEPLAISPEILFKRGHIIGSTQNDREHLYEALDYVAKGKVRVMTEIFPLEDISNAYDKVANGNVRFKAVIHTPLNKSTVTLPISVRFNQFPILAGLISRLR